MTPAERIAQEWFETTKMWADGDEETRQRLIASVQDLLDRGVIRDGSPIAVHRQRQDDAAQFVTDLAAAAGIDRIDGFLVMYYFRQGEGFGIGTVSSTGDVWESVKRFNEHFLAQHLVEALRHEQIQGNGAGQIIAPGGGIIKPGDPRWS